VIALASLRDGAWLTPDRLRGYPAVFLALWVVGAALWVGLSHGIMDPWGRPLGSDFMGFWATAQLLLSGDGLAAYDEARLTAAQVAAAGTTEVPHYTMLYPPPGLLLILPLGLPPYLPALALWVLGTMTAYLTVLWRAWRHPLVPYLALAAPAVFVTVSHGQNAFLSGALLGGGLLLLPRWPVLAGVLFGLLVYKPHLGLVLPLALLVAGHWRAIAAATATVTALSLAATLAFGWAIWPAFLTRTAFAREVLEQGYVPFFKMQSLYTALRLLGVEAGPAFAAHWTLAALVILSLAALWRWGGDHRLKAAGLMTAAVLATPFVLDYDLALLGLPIVLLARDGAERGFLPWDKTVLAAAWALPLFARPVGQLAHLGLAWLVVLLLYAVALRRAWRLRMPPA
jgi:hypothetical protein